MKKSFEIRVIPRAKKELIKEENGKLKVYVTSPAQDGRANEAVVDLLAQHFKTKKSCVKIVKGTKSRNKIIELTK